MTPDNYNPKTPSELVGHAGVIGEQLLRHVQSVSPTDATLKLLLYGHPGNGKTSIAQMLAGALSQSVDIESINGRNVSIDTVREWQRNAAYGSLFGGWKVKIINETDLIPTAAQDLMLTYLDEMRPQTAIIGTSNIELGGLTERFQTRFRLVKINGTEMNELRDWLVETWNVPIGPAQFIAMGACGNVRRALLEASNYLVLGELGERKLPTVTMLNRNGNGKVRKAA